MKNYSFFRTLSKGRLPTEDDDIDDASPFDAPDADNNPKAARVVQLIPKDQTLEDSLEGKIYKK